MANGTEAAIAEALLGRLDEIPLFPKPDIAWPGLAFTPPAEAYLEAQLLTNANVNRGIADSSSTEFRGIFQVAVMWPSGQSIIGAMQMAGTIADHFERGAAIKSGGLIVKIEGRPSIASPIQEPSRLRVPVSIRYYAFA